MFKEIFLDAPCVGEAEKEYLCKAVDSGFVSSFGPFVPEFEKKMANYLSVKSAVAVQSGTAAIYISLYELGIGPGDEVIVPALTFAATVNPVLYVGATPVIVDVDINTWNIDSIKIKEAITDKTKAIIPVHLYGNPCNMTEILGIAKEYNLYVIEDATESLGAKINNKYTGTFGNFGCFSFNGNKLITTGGGGMVVSDDTDRIEHIRYLVNQSKDQDRPGLHSEMGFNYRMTNIQAALGISQSERIEEFLAIKKDIYSRYRSSLTELMRFQKENGVSSRWISAGMLQTEVTVQQIRTLLFDKGVPTRRVFMPVEQMPYLKSYSPRENKKAVVVYEQGICLPSSTVNLPVAIDRIIDILREVL